jgi:hypothetical protein
VCNRGSERIYLQSAYDILDAEKLAQKQRLLDKIDVSFKKVIVVGRPVERLYGKTGVLMLGPYDFLLDPASLKL